MKSLWLLFVSLFIMVSCTTPPKLPVPAPVATPSPEGENIDWFSLQKSLGLERPVEELGYAEKKYNTCKVGYGYSPTHRCRNMVLAVIHFRLQCRASEGTVSEVVSLAELIPVGNAQVRWELGGQRGAVPADEEGFGQIVVATNKSPKNGRLKLIVNNDFLLMQASQIKRVVVPANWCP